MRRSPGVEPQRRFDTEAVLSRTIEKHVSEHLFRQVKAGLSVTRQISVTIDRGGGSTGHRVNHAADDHELEKPGDFMTRRIVGEPIIIACNKDLTLHSYYNMCAHRDAHFTSKDNLLERSLERLHALLIHALEPQSASHKLYTKAKWAPCRVLFEHVHAYKDVQALLARGRGGAILQDAVDAVLMRVFRPLVAADPGRRLPDDLIARHIISTFHTVLTWWSTVNPEMKASNADAIFRRMLLYPLSPTTLAPFMSLDTGGEPTADIKIARATLLRLCHPRRPQ